MASAFSTSESTSLERTVDVQSGDEDSAAFERIWNSERLKDCTDWLTKGSDFKRVCLQFPDNLLGHSTQITKELNGSVANIEFYILGDTSYGSCCVDEIAASHIDADAIIHFGHACLSKVIRLPLFYVFPNYKLQTERLAAELLGQFPNKDANLFIFYNVGHYYQLESIKAELTKHYENVKFGELAIESEASLLNWTNSEDWNVENCTCIYLGKDDQTFFNLTISLKASTWYIYNETNGLKFIDPLSTNWMRRRYFYIEKCKDAQSMGIVVGTLTAKGYLDLVKHIQQLARHRGIRTYLISVGKVNPPKLANFMEIDCFVLIGCPENNLFTSRDFYKPLLSVFEVEVALNPAWHLQIPENYSVDFKEILPNGKLFRDYTGEDILESDVSLVTGKIRGGTAEVEHINNQNGILQERKNYQLMENNSSSNALQNRSWTGLEPALGLTEPAKIEKGRSGIAMKYSDDFE